MYHMFITNILIDAIKDITTFLLIIVTNFLWHFLAIFDWYFFTVFPWNTVAFLFGKLKTFFCWNGLTDLIWNLSAYFPFNVFTSIFRIRITGVLRKIFSKLTFCSFVTHFTSSFILFRTFCHFDDFTFVYVCSFTFASRNRFTNF